MATHFSQVASQAIIEFSQPIMRTVIAGEGIADLNMTKADVDQLREGYLKLMNLPDRQEAKLAIIAVALNLKRAIEKTASERQEFPVQEELDYEVFLPNDGSAEHGTLVQINKAVFTIGRRSECDLKLNDGLYPNSSRLHAVCFVLPSRVVVVDPGSLLGIKTIDRRTQDGELPKQDSLPAQRKVLQFARNESFSLDFAGQKVIFRPLKCVICLVNPREMLTDCGHFLLCRECSYRQQQDIQPRCYACRKPMGHRPITAALVNTFNQT